MAESLDLSTLAAQANAYYREHNQDMHEELTIGLFDGEHSLADRFTFVDGLTDEMQLYADVVDDFLHQHVPAQAGSFNPTAGVINVIPRFLKVRKYEGDLFFSDDQMETSNLMYLGLAKQMAKKMPSEVIPSLIDYLFGKVIIAKAQETLRKSIIQGAYDPTAPRSWTKILDGVEKRISDAVTAGQVTPVALSAMTTQNVVPQIESVFDELGTAYKKANDAICLVSSTVYAKLTRADLASLGRSDKFDSGQGALTIAGYTNCQIKEEPNLTGTKVLVYRKSNALVGFDTAGIKPWEMQRIDRANKMMLNGKLDFNFKAINNDPSNLNIAYGEL